MFFVGGSRPVRSAPPVKPSAQPFFFRPRVPRTEHALSNLEPIWPQGAAGNPSTNARPTEMPMKQREPE